MDPEEPLPTFSFEKAPGLIVTERDLDAMPWSRERKVAEKHLISSSRECSPHDRDQ